MDDELTSGREARRFPRWAVVTGAVVLVVAAGADRFQLVRERSALTRCFAEGSAAVLVADRRVQAMVSYTSPQQTAAGASEAVRDDLEGLVRDTAREGVLEVGEAATACRHGRVLPWHRDVLRDRRTFVAYLDEQRLRLGDTAKGEPLSP